MENTIEFGGRFQVGVDDVTVLQKLKDLYSFNHLQVVSTDFASLEESLKKIRAVMDIYEVELSSVVKSSNYNIYQDYKTLFDICKTYGIKYFILDLEEHILFSDIALHELIKNVTQISDSNRIFTCLNLHVNSVFSEQLRNFERLNSSIGSDFLLLSVETSTLTQTPMILNESSFLRKWCGVLNVKVDSKPTQFQTDIYPLVDKLFWLPWKEKPLIFTNPLQENFMVFQKYLEIIENGNYYYP